MEGLTVRRLPISAAEVKAVGDGVEVLLVHQGQVVGTVSRFTGNVRFPRSCSDTEAAKIWAETKKEGAA